MMKSRETGNKNKEKELKEVSSSLCIGRIVTVREDGGCSDMSKSEELILTADGQVLLGETYEGSFLWVACFEKGEREKGLETLEKVRARIAKRLGQLHAELQTCEAIESQLNQL